ncbi:tetratricopeptide repeat protein [Streptomyces sp. NBC_01635]|uniref:tetratricopeptide repeat protein n=1 Tax=Streptomyces sp. NBC_01635 TaxID=2975904 RepID=UPI003868CD0B|nr:tetratricopeptide repeat protein [Streptomyces sp. NBC_01635]
MARISREKKQEQQQAAHAADLAAVPIDVHIPVAVGGGAGTRRASVGGVLVVAGPGEEVQQAVLNRLHRIAVASGHAVLATIHDERIGYVVPLQVDPDGASRFTGEPAPMTPEPDSEPESARTPGRNVAQKRPVAAPHDDAPPFSAVPGPAAVPSPRPGHDRPTHVLRPVPDPTSNPIPTSIPGPTPIPAATPIPGSIPASTPAPDSAPDLVRDSAPDCRPRPMPGAAGAIPLGTVAPPTGEFGPPPSMDARPHPAPEADGRSWIPPAPPRPPASPLSPADRIPSPLPATAAPAPKAVRPRTPAPRPEAVHGTGTDLDSKPTPPRGFDAVAEAVLADEPSAVPGETHLAEPMGRINDAVRAGRIDTAARLAGETVTEASQTLGPEHPEVLRLRELTAYIAYLGDEPLHAFRLSLELAGIHRRAGDAEAAYGNVRSAATAWRAVRDPLRGLELGRDLIELWTALAAEDGPAADEIEELESARARMGRLTDRARAQHG